VPDVSSVVVSHQFTTPGRHESFKYKCLCRGRRYKRPDVVNYSLVSVLLTTDTRSVPVRRTHSVAVAAQRRPM